MGEKAAELWVIAILSCLAIYFLTIVDEIPFSSLPGGLGPRTFPRAVFIIILVLNTVLLVSDYFEKRKRTSAQRSDTILPAQGTVWKIFPYINPKVLGVAGLAVLLTFGWQKIGFLISSFVFLFITALLVAPSGKKPLRTSLILSVGFTVTLAILFVYIFEIPLNLGFSD